MLNKNRIIIDNSPEVREYRNTEVLFLRVQDILENNIEIKKNFLFLINNPLSPPKFNNHFPTAKNQNNY